MIFRKTALEGVTEIALEPHADSRGSFARLYCQDEWHAAGLSFTATQVNLSRNTAIHTLRGMHFQEPPYAEAKIVRVVSGAIHDVVVDVRRDSTTFLQWFGCTLDARRGNALFIPEGFAHGFLTLAPETDVLYQMGRPYVAGQARGLRYDDPRIGIAWPHAPAVVGDADRAWPLLNKGPLKK